MIPSIEADFQRELAEIEAESMGWTPLEDGVYLYATANGTTATEGLILVGVAAQGDGDIENGILTLV